MLSHCFKIYVPSTTDINISVDNSASVANTLQFLSGLFGGATSYDARGAWVSDSAGLVLENVTICYAFCSLSQKVRNRRAVLDFAKDLCKTMRQEAISVEIDGRLFFIS